MLPYACCSGAPHCLTSSPIQLCRAFPFNLFTFISRPPLYLDLPQPLLGLLLPRLLPLMALLPSAATVGCKILNQTSPVPNLPLSALVLRIKPLLILCGSATSLMLFSFSPFLAHSLPGPPLARLLLASGPLLPLCPPPGHPSLVRLLSSFSPGLRCHLPSCVTFSPSLSLHSIISLRAPSTMDSFSLFAACASPASPLRAGLALPESLPYPQFPAHSPTLIPWGM